MSSGSNNTSGGSLSKALQILNIVTKADEAPNFSVIVAETALPKATVHRLLSSLQAERLIRFDQRRECYMPGYGLLELAHKAWAGIDVRELAADQMKSVWQATGETVHLAVLDAGDVIYIDKMESLKSLRMFSAVGKKGPAYCTGVGKAMMAFLEDDELEIAIKSQSFVQHTKNTLVTVEQLKAVLQQIREQGFAIDDEEHELGIACVAAPILDYRGQVVAGISVTAPLFRTNDTAFNDFKQLIKQAAQEISSRMGYTHQD